MATLWIVHRDAGARAALARLAGERAALVGAPADPRFQSAAPPRVVVLGVAGDFEAELEFAHRLLVRADGTSWILLAEPLDRGEAERLFDALPAELLSFPPPAHALRARLAALRGRRAAEPLSARRARDLLADRFARWFADLELPALLPALDPRLAEVPLLVRGEPGTGRALLARYVHWFGAKPEALGRFEALACTSDLDRDALLAALARAAGQARCSGRASLCLEDVDQLPAHLQSELADWIESGPPAAAQGARLRWIATAGPSLDPARRLLPRLEQSLAGLGVEIPALRTRPAAIRALVERTAQGWARARGERARAFAPDALAALSEHPWPENMRELEAVVLRSLALERADPLHQEHLRFDAAAPEGAPAAAGPAGPAPGEPLVAELLEGEASGPELEAELEAALEAPQREVGQRAPLGDAALRRIAGAVAHGVRNPLVAIRTFAELLPERHADPEFRQRFAELVGSDARRIQAVVDRLARFASLGEPEPARVDVAALLEELLEQRRASIEKRRLLVLRELDREAPLVASDPEQLRFALDALLARAVELVPERGDLYLASKHHPTGLRGRPCVRVLLRLQRPPGAGPEPGEGLRLEETALELPLAEAVVRAQGGELAVDASRSDEALVVLDLPAAEGA